MKFVQAKLLAGSCQVGIRHQGILAKRQLPCTQYFSPLRPHVDRASVGVPSALACPAMQVSYCLAVVWSLAVLQAALL